MPLSEYDKEHIEDIICGQGDWFTAELIRLINKADVNNCRKLATVFPDEVDAVNKWRRGQLTQPRKWSDKEE